ncbi:hypothetical protein GCM10009819_07390 [Agromyces tropicus]|uniref:HTH gntR-type domain-containing protein n=1 Tax=Agromyces tropicus TaxID=555371 RepID=A0ABN2U1Z2_9MICO
MSTSAAETSLAEQAYRDLRARIVRLELPPGAKLSERTLAVKTGFGITPIREALARLRQEHLVESLPRVGTRVAPLTLRDMREILDVWSLIGPEVFRLGVARLGPDQVEHVRQLAEDAVRLRTDPSREPHEWTAPSSEIYDLLCRMCGNQRLARLAKDAEAEVQRVFSVIMSDRAAAEKLRSAEMPPFPPLEPEQAELAATQMAEFHRRFADQILQIGATWPSVLDAEVGVPTVLATGS